MNILAFSAGKFSSLDGSVVRFKNLVVERSPHDEIVWIDGSTQAIYKNENLDQRIPKNVKLVRGYPSGKNPAFELFAREKHYYENALRYAGWADVAVFYSPWGCALARRALKKRGVPLAFDYIDLIHEFRSNALERAVSRRAVVQALRESDLVITTALKLFEDARHYNKNVALIPNGVDLKKISAAKPTPLKKRKVQKPAVGFVGGFGKWVDLNSVLGAARKMRGVHFYFIGDGVQRKNLEAAARELKNVFVSPQYVPQPLAFEWMASMDVCLVPLLKNELTDAVCPIKLFEYWGLKKPVISTRIFEVERIAKRDAVLYASTPEEFEIAIEKLLCDKKLRSKIAAKGFAKAKAFDWRKLSEKFLKRLHEAESTKS